MLENNIIFSSKDDNLESIIEKINSGKDIEEKFKIYSLFYITIPKYVKAINISLQIWEPKLWKLIRKSYYPNFWEIMMKKIGFS